MKEIYHICWTAHSEVLLRCLDDVRIMTNLSALAALRTGTDILVSSDMSTHSHRIILSEDPGAFVRSFKIGSTKAFNAFHKRSGELFDSDTFILPIQGPRHIQMAMNYVLRQGLHHGACETAFCYPWSSCNSLFRHDRGLEDETDAGWSKGRMKEFVSRNMPFPDSWKADRNGILLRSSYEQTRMAENWYGSARSFMFSMIRRTSEEWIGEQEKDNTGEPRITLDLLERGVGDQDIKAMLEMEQNSKYHSKPVPDMEICNLIDTKMVPRLRMPSIYSCSMLQKRQMAEELRRVYRFLPEKQMRRCLVMDY